MTAEELLALTDEQRHELDLFDYKAANAHCSDCSDCSYCSGCSYCSYCSDCSGCSRCLNCSDCYGIVDGRNLRFVYKGIQLTEEQYRSIVK